MCAIDAASQSIWLRSDASLLCGQTNQWRKEETTRNCRLRLQGNLTAQDCRRHPRLARETLFQIYSSQPPGQQGTELWILNCDDIRALGKLKNHSIMSHDSCANSRRFPGERLGHTPELSPATCGRQRDSLTDIHCGDDWHTQRFGHLDTADAYSA